MPKVEALLLRKISLGEKNIYDEHILPLFKFKLFKW